MADSGESLRMTPGPISGGSTTEAELGVPGVAWPARVARSESPLAQGLRRFRRSTTALVGAAIVVGLVLVALFADALAPRSPIASEDRKSTRLNSSHTVNSYAVFCLKKKTNMIAL